MFVELIIGDRLRKLRESKGLSCDEIATQCNLPPSFIQGIENAHTFLSSDVIAKIMKVLDIDEEVFYRNIIESNFFNKAFIFEVLQKSGTLCTKLCTNFFAHLRSSISIEDVSIPSGVTHFCPCDECQDGILSIDYVRNLWYCETCNNGGDLITYLMHRDNLEFKDAIKFAYKEYILKEWQFELDVNKCNEEMDIKSESATQEIHTQEKDSIILSSTALKCAFDVIQSRIIHKRETTGIPSGLKALDEITGGFHDCDLIVIGGCPSMGKTVLVQTVIQNTTLCGHVVGLFSLNLHSEQIMTRLLCSVGEVDTIVARYGHIQDNDWYKLDNSMQKLSEIHLVFDGSPRLTLNQLKERAKIMQNKHGVQILIIDSLQDLFDETHERYTDYSVISRELKQLARELNIPVVITARLSRNVERRASKRPLIYDLQGKVPIEQDADVILFIYREGYYHMPSADEAYESPEIEKTEINVAKNKSGPTGRIQVGLFHSYARFEDIEE